MGELNLPDEIDKTEIRQAYQAQIALLDNGISQWATMNSNQKQAWLVTNFGDVMSGQEHYYAY